MKLLIFLCAVMLSGCAWLVPHSGVYVGGEDRCYTASQWGCHLYVKNGYTVNGVGVNLDMVDGEIGGMKPPRIVNNM